MSKKPLILGIETSCDETAASIIQDDSSGVPRILSNIVSSQYDIHKKFGGVVPDLAARAHVEKIDLIVQEALSKSKINIKNFWVVRQFKNEYNPVHYHDGNISGVGYLKIPKNLNFSKKKKKTNGTIDFINGSRMFLNKSIYNHVPKVGDLILFPNYLMHTAYPFVVDGERRSFSFNVELDKKVADVFHD